MKLLMVYIKPNGQLETVVGTGTIEACEREIELLTEQHESKGCWMVNEITENNKLTRQFATANDGHIFDLVICEENKILTHYVEY